MTQPSLTEESNRRWTSMLVVGLLVASSQFAGAQGRASVTGTWQISVVHGHAIPFGLQLEQDGSKVTGTLAIPPVHGGTREAVPLEGTIVDGVLTLETAAHAESTQTKVTLDGRLRDDGTMEGTIVGKMGTMKWTAERLRARSVR
jgi:hypothetical protein